MAVVLFATPLAHAAPTLPEIRISRSNPVPACVTPDRLMAFLQNRNGRLLPQFRNIAAFYKQHGEAWGVRWDYAFFQMAIETNFLTYRAPSGRMGDVDPKQNNFAGIGTTGGGVPGDSFPDVSTGVLGQIQHLVVYSGEMIANPVAPRTQLKQEHILAKSRELKRSVRFSDLAGRWAVDRKYGGSIEWVAERFRAENCKGRNAKPVANEARAEAPRPMRAAQADPAAVVKTIARRDSPASDKKLVVKKAEALPRKPEVTLKKAPDVREQPAQSTAKVEEQAAAPAVIAEADEARFALFTPPAGLAHAKIPVPVAPVQPVTRPEPIAQREPENPAHAKAPAPDAVPAPDATAGPQSHHEVAAEAVAKEPSDAPVAVAGASVGGFMVGGPKKSDFVPPSGLGVKPGRCAVQTASFGGQTTVLVKTSDGADVQYVALSVIDGFEDSMMKSFLASRGSDGELLGTFPSREGALAKARILCPD